MENIAHPKLIGKKNIVKRDTRKAKIAFIKEAREFVERITELNNRSIHLRQKWPSQSQKQLRNNDE